MKQIDNNVPGQHTFRIVKLSCDTIETLIIGMYCEGIRYKFPKTFLTLQEAEKHLKRYFSRKQKSGSKARQVIGYMIQEIYFEEINGEELCCVYRQWSYAPDGRFLADGYINSEVEYEGCEPQTLPFRKGDYVIACHCGVLLLASIGVEPNTPAEVIEIKSSPHTPDRWKGIEDLPAELLPDPLNSGYVANFIDGFHGHVWVSDVFPLPFDISEIPAETIAALHWAYNDSQPTDGKSLIV